MCITNVDVYDCHHEILRNVKVCREWRDGTYVDPRRWPLARNPHYEHELLTPRPGSCGRCELQASHATEQAATRKRAEQIKQSLARQKGREDGRKREIERREAQAKRGTEQRREEPQLATGSAQAIAKKRVRGVSAPETLVSSSAQAPTHVSKKTKVEADRPRADSSKAQASIDDSNAIKPEPETERAESSKAAAQAPLYNFRRIKAEADTEDTKPIKTEDQDTLSMADVEEKEATAVKVLSGLEAQKLRESMRASVRSGYCETKSYYKSAEGGGTW